MTDLSKNQKKKTKLELDETEEIEIVDHDLSKKSSKPVTSAENDGKKSRIEFDKSLTENTSSRPYLVAKKDSQSRSILKTTSKKSESGSKKSGIRIEEKDLPKSRDMDKKSLSQKISIVEDFHECSKKNSYKIPSIKSGASVTSDQDKKWNRRYQIKPSSRVAKKVKTSRIQSKEFDEENGPRRIKSLIGTKEEQRNWANLRRATDINNLEHIQNVYVPSDESDSDSEENELYDSRYLLRLDRLDMDSMDTDIGSKSRSRDRSIASSRTSARSYTSTKSYDTSRSLISGSSGRKTNLTGKPEPDIDNTVPFLPEKVIGLNVEAKFRNLTTNALHPFVFYAASHIGVIENYNTNYQRFLLGHKNSIRNVDCDAACRWLVTADQGPDNSVIIWDSDAVPIHTLFNPHDSYSVEKLMMSYDAKYLVTVGNEPHPIVKFWEWSYGFEEPNDMYVMEAGSGVVQDITNSVNHTNRFMITFEHKVIFLSWNFQSISIACPAIKKKNFGNFVSSTYLTGSSVCATATDKGFVLLFGCTHWLQKYSLDKSNNDKIHLKTFKVQTDKITIITSVNRLFVTGDVLGHIKFYDRKMRLLYFINKLNLKPIVHIEFHRYHRKASYQDIDEIAQRRFIQYRKDEKRHSYRKSAEEEKCFELNRQMEELGVPVDATLVKSPFIMRDFIILTADSQVEYINFMTLNRDIIIKRKEGHISAMDLHNESPIICLGYENGKLIAYNYAEKVWMVERYLPQQKEDKDNAITAIKFANNDILFCVGQRGGSFHSLHPITLEMKCEPFKMESEAILGIRYTRDNQYCAFWDAASGICLFSYTPFDICNWKFLRRIKAHHKPIVDLLFIPTSDRKCSHRLITIGEDRLLIEYDIDDIDNGNISVLSCIEIEQTAIPRSILYYFTGRTGKFLISENKFKFKVLADNTFDVEKTILGPIFDDPIRKMKMIHPKNFTYSEYMLFSTKNYIGIHHMPPDGNPYKYVAMLGHPIELLDFALNRDRTHVATVGKKDYCCILWRIKINSVRNMINQGGKDLTPFYTLIEGGIDGWLSKEMHELFYYMQILNQDEDSPDPRKITNKIPANQIPNMMRAVGFYPTEYELKNLMKEAKVSFFDEKTKVYEITYEDFIKLYINHRPAFGITREALENAFYTAADDDIVDKSKFYKILCENGEAFTEDTLKACLTMLTQANRESRNEHLDKVPEFISVENFIFNMLGISFRKKIQFENIDDDDEEEE